MNKNIKRIVAMVLAIGTFSVAGTLDKFNLMMTRAYASSGPEKLESLELEDKHNNNIQLYDSNDYSNSVDNDDIHIGDTYYADVTTSKVEIDISGADESNVRIFKGDSETAYEVGDEITLSSGITRLKVKVYEDSYEDYEDYDDAEDSDYDQYSLRIEYTNDTFDNETETLDNLEILDDNDDELMLYTNDDYNEEIDTDEVDEGEIYYAKTSSDVSVDIVGPDEEYVKIFKETSDSAEGVDPGDTIKITSDKILTVRIYSVEPDSDITYEDDENVIGEYQINLKYTGTAISGTGNSNATGGDAEAAKYDDIYLEKLSVDSRMIELSDSKVNYIYNVDSNVSKVTVRATPEDIDYNVVIDGKKVTRSDNYKALLELDKGSNAFKIKINDSDGNERIYTLVINRGNVSEPALTKIVNQWVKVDGLWKYNDASGKPVTNTWVKNYYLKSDGTMATQWQNINGNWYYFGEDGAKKTGWQRIGTNWYYLDAAEGKMKTGWFKDTDGKYYYLNSNGDMAFNTTINGYKLGTSGAWVK